LPSLFPHCGRPETDAPELARRLANVVERKKQGRPPKGKYTRKMIVEWVMRKSWNTTRAAQVSRARKKEAR
jgi:hypothetical protein